MFARLSKWDVRFLVASPRVQDLLFSAKHLFGAAKIVWHAHKLLIRGQEMSGFGAKRKSCARSEHYRF